MEIQYDTVADTKFHWRLSNWKTRTLKGLKEHIQSGASKDTVLLMEPTDLVYSKGQQETFTSPELLDYISKQTSRGSGNVVQYEVEFHKRIAMSFSSFILTIIGLSLSSRKRKGGMGLYPGIEFQLHHASDSIFHLCHPVGHTAASGSMDTEHYLCRHRLLLLPPCAELIRHIEQNELRTTLCEEGKNSRICILKI